MTNPRLSRGSDGTGGTFTGGSCRGGGSLGLVGTSRRQVRPARRRVMTGIR